MFTLGFLSEATNYKDSIKVLINYVQHEYSAGVYLRQAIKDGKVPDLAITKKSPPIMTINQMPSLIWMFSSGSKTPRPSL